MPAPRHGLSLGIRLFLHGARLTALICLALGVVVVLGAAKSRGSFARRARMSECKGNLRSAFTAEKVYFGDHQSYSDDLSLIGFDPERGNRYAYFAAASGTMQDRSAATLPKAGHHQAVGVDRFQFEGERDLGFDRVIRPIGAPLGLLGTGPDCQITLICLGDLDGEGQLDAWSVSTLDRTARTGEPIPAGVPYHDTAPRE